MAAACRPRQQAVCAASLTQSDDLTPDRLTVAGPRPMTMRGPKRSPPGRTSMEVGSCSLARFVHATAQRPLPGGAGRGSLRCWPHSSCCCRAGGSPPPRRPPPRRRPRSARSDTTFPPRSAAARSRRSGRSASWASTAGGRSARTRASRRSTQWAKRRPAALRRLHQHREPGAAQRLLLARLGLPRPRAVPRQPPRPATRAAPTTTAGTPRPRRSPWPTASTRPLRNRTWWLDVETVNSWNGDGIANAADLQGVVDLLRSKGVARVGLYSTAYQWRAITGGYTASSAGDLPHRVALGVHAALPPRVGPAVDRHHG